MRWSSALILICAAFSGLFALAFYDRYWRWRDCFNELGRCYDPVGGVVYLEQAGVVWGLLAAIPAIAALMLWRRAHRRSRGPQRGGVS